MHSSTLHISCLVCIFCIAIGNSQNLIKNPSFEEFESCPGQLGNFDEDVRYWSTPTIGSTDYFNACSTAMGTPKNFNGTQPADFGVGYAGLYLYAPDDYREYLQAELLETLVKDKKYRISFYISLAERSDFAIKEFGVLFSKNVLHFPIRKELSKMHLYKDRENKYNLMEIGYSNFYSDTQDWILVHTEFRAKGNENFISIGNFKSNKRTRLFKTKRNAKQGAYYYIDMVLLESAEPTDFAEKPITINERADVGVIELDKTHVFENVLFDFDDFEIRNSAKKEMQKVYDYLRKDSSLQIAINGHTDSIGSEAYNLSLSNQRAQAVADYLVDMGLLDSRINWQGQGGLKPIASNASEEGRSKNRRVEFTISKKKKE
jgi:outer membrane protein OmpA-like peptidoglycan-associated protein